MFNGTDDYIDKDLRREFERHILTTDGITPNETLIFEVENAVILLKV